MSTFTSLNMSKKLKKCWSSTPRKLNDKLQNLFSFGNVAKYVLHSPLASLTAVPVCTFKSRLKMVNVGYYPLPSNGGLSLLHLQKSNVCVKDTGMNE